MRRLVESAHALAPEIAQWALTAAARSILTEARRSHGEGGFACDPDSLSRLVVARARDLVRPHPGRVVNATGVVLHTNLGRAPLAPGAARAAAEAASRFSDLEFDLAAGSRGSRLSAVVEKLVLLSGAEAALAVNNNAAAVLLALDSFARGREVVVSRGELVEIGGSFRVPEILERAGVRLVEVGTTNRTHPEDYRRAIGPQTALLLKVHRSNFEQRGFVTEVGIPELAEIGRERGLPVIEDLGSGTLLRLDARGIPAEVHAPSRLAMGADVVCFSGDKLLGGPQAGIALGRAKLVQAMSRNPLARALRLDKLSLAALDWTLRTLLDGRAEREIPALRQLLESADQLAPRARRLAERLAKAVGNAAAVSLEPDHSAVGGGSLPGFEPETWVVAIRSDGGAHALASNLRRAVVPVLARIRDDALLLDVRTLLDDDPEAIETALTAALAPEPD